MSAVCSTGCSGSVWSHLGYLHPLVEVGLGLFLVPVECMHFRQPSCFVNNLSLMGKISHLCYATEGAAAVEVPCVVKNPVSERFF